MWDKNTILNGKRVHPQVDEFDLAKEIYIETFSISDFGPDRC